MHTPDQLRQWQHKAASILASHDYQLLGAQPGSGKTITTLTAMAQQPRRTMLVAPAIILDSVWPNEAESWLHTHHLTFDLAHRYSGADRARLWFEGRADVVTCTPDTLIKFAHEVERRGVMPVRRLVVDESQFFKNATAVRTMARTRDRPALVWLYRIFLGLNFCSAVGFIVYALLLENPPSTALPL